MKVNYLICFFISLLFSAGCASEPQGLQALSSWTNQSGSTLTINSIDQNGLLSGTYINREQGYGCQNIAYPVTGWVYGTAITFTTLWQSSSESCNSITAWTGFYYQGAISTLWQLSVNGSSSTSQIIQGSDTFSPATAVIKQSLLPKK